MSSKEVKGIKDWSFYEDPPFFNETPEDVKDATYNVRMDDHLDKGAFAVNVQNRNDADDYTDLMFEINKGRPSLTVAVGGVDSLFTLFMMPDGSVVLRPNTDDIGAEHVFHHPEFESKVIVFKRKEP